MGRGFPFGVTFCRRDLHNFLLPSFPHCNPKIPLNHSVSSLRSISLFVSFRVFRGCLLRFASSFSGPFVPFGFSPSPSPACLSRRGPKRGAL